MSRTITTNYSNGLTLTNTSDSPVYLNAGVTVANGTGAALYSNTGFFWAITNRNGGLVAGGQFGVSLAGAGTLTNNGSITSSYTAGQGFSYNSTAHVLIATSGGAYLGGGGLSNSQTGVINGGIIGAALGGTGSIVNAGLISNTLTSGGFGVVFDVGGSLSNQSGGTVSGGGYAVIANGAVSIANQPSATITGSIRGIFQLNGAGTVDNQGVINSGTNAVEMRAGGTVTNALSASVSGGVFGVLISGGRASVTNSGNLTGSVVSGVYLASGGGVSNQSGATITGGDGAVIAVSTYASVYNAGFLQQTTPFSGQTYAIGGVLLLSGGSVANHGGTISGASYGVDIASAAGTVTNSGLITASLSGGGAAVVLVSGGSVANSGRIVGHDYGLLVANAAGSASNTGTIASYLYYSGAGAGLRSGGSFTNAASAVVAGNWIGLQSGAFNAQTSSAAPMVTFDNSGTIQAADTKGDGAAIWVHGPGVVINRASGVVQGATNGTIVGGPLNGKTQGGFGVVAYYQTTLINYGSIGGAVYGFDAAGTAASIGNRIEVAPGASFGGVVLGAHTSAEASLSSLELMSSAAIGTITGFGTRYENFGNVIVDAGARWTLFGSVAPSTAVSFAGTGNALLAFANPTQMQGTVTGFGLGDTLLFAGITASGSNIVAGGVTLTGASFGTLAVAMTGSFAPGALVVTNVAGVGTEILYPVVRTFSWTGAQGATFGAAGNWNDLTDTQNPSQFAPGPFDTVQFNTAGGAIAGGGGVGTIDVATTGAGVLELSGGETLAANSFDAGQVAGAIGQVGMTGTATALQINGAAVVADDGTGVLAVLGGATFAASSLTIGSQADSSGVVVVSGAGSLIDLSGALNVGTALGIGDLTIGPGATVNAGVVNLNGDVVLEGGELDPSVNLINPGNTLSGSGVIANNVIVDEGLLLANGQKLSQRLLTITGTIVGGGTLTVNGTVTASGSPGIIQINASDTIDLTGPVVNAATTTFTDNQTPTGTYTVNNSVIDVVFADGTGVLLLDDIAGFGGTIATFKTGDAFVIGGGTLSGLGVSNGNTLTFSDGGTKAAQGGVDSLIFGSAVSASRFAIVNNDTVQAVACFAAGTRIETDIGPAPVETLRVGTMLKTHGGAVREIVWIGQREVDCRHHPRPEAVYPVRVAAGAFRPGVPSRELWLSPDHAIFVDGVLIPVRLLSNGGTIRQVAVSSIVYFHVELPEHGVIRAEGLAVESYLDTGDRANFINGGAPPRLFADFGARTWETAGCAPLVLAGPTVARAREALARRGAIISVPLSARTPRINNRYTYY